MKNVARKTGEPSRIFTAMLGFISYISLEEKKQMILRILEPITTFHKNKAITKIYKDFISFLPEGPYYTQIYIPKQI